MTARFLVDTHVWLWYAQGNRQRLSGRAAEHLTDLDKQGRIHLSVMSVWELGMLDAKGRIHLGQPCLKWVETFLERTRFQLIKLGIATAVGAHALPDFDHADPADRLLVATARHHDLTLFTEDHKILDYAQQGYVRAHSSNDMELLNR